MRRLQFAIVGTAIFGLLDAGYLTFEHFFGGPVACSVSAFADCGSVLGSVYAVLWGVPVALWGVLQYLAVLYWSALAYFFRDKLGLRMLFVQTALGLVFSAYFIFLQLVVIRSICVYCMLSALASTALYVLVRVTYRREYRTFVREKIGLGYRLFVKPLLFLIPADVMHDMAMKGASFVGSLSVGRFLSPVFAYHHPALRVKVGKIIFKNPIGLSAGYDYTASFVHVLPHIGFGYETVGTVSAKPCAGNELPRLGRLPKSRALLVNKGFRNPGADAIIKKLGKKPFLFPVGISIGRTNDDTTLDLPSAIKDIVEGFKKFEASSVRHQYYELNISCPNLKGSLSLYPPEHLKKLLDAVKKLKIFRPVFVKMPIEKTDDEVREMLAVIARYPFVTGVIFGNLQKDRHDPALDPDEVQIAGKGNFSGKPTYRRSNELIRLTYRAYRDRFVIIGCGGIFTAEDAYRKIRSGATLLQLITGMIYQGPQQIGLINEGLVELLKQDGFTRLEDAVGMDAKISS